MATNLVQKIVERHLQPAEDYIFGFADLTQIIDPSISTESLETTYHNTLRTSLSHKMVATRAGLGWIGKTDLLVTKEFGPRLRFVSILTSTPLENLRESIDRSRCGTCRDCFDICPAKAATGQLWDTSTDRDEFFDAGKCRDMCQYFGEKILDNDGRICGICVSVCPIGKRNTQ